MDRELIRSSICASIRVRRCRTRTESAGLKPRRVAESVPNINSSTLGSLSREKVVHVNTRIHTKSVLIKGMAPGKRARLATRRELLHTVFNRGTHRMESASLGMPRKRCNVMMSTGMFAERGKSRLSPKMGRTIHVCVTRGEGVSINSGVTKQRKGGNIISHMLPMRSVPFLPGKHPLSVILGPLNIPSHVGVKRILRVRLDLTTGTLKFGMSAPMFTNTGRGSVVSALSLTGSCMGLR